jgi:hypothetical protein
LHEIYDNYSHYLKRARQAKEWMTQYSFSSNKEKYRTFINPEKIVLAEENTIEGNCIFTNSENLYKKYNRIL